MKLSRNTNQWHLHVGRMIGERRAIPQSQNVVRKSQNWLMVTNGNLLKNNFLYFYEVIKTDIIVNYFILLLWIYGFIYVKS
jgi:hypothetical protein